MRIAMTLVGPHCHPLNIQSSPHCVRVNLGGHKSASKSVEDKYNPFKKITADSIRSNGKFNIQSKVTGLIHI